MITFTTLKSKWTPPLLIINHCLLLRLVRFQGVFSYKMDDRRCNEMCLAVVNNIPSFYHSVDLRIFFSQFIESGRFDCFHFRHRPEKQMSNNDLSDFVREQNVNESGTTTCCVIRLKRKYLTDLLKLYHRTNWLNKNGDSIAEMCYISEIDSCSIPNKSQSNKDVILNSSESIGSTGSSSKLENKKDYTTRKEKRKIPENRVEFTEEDLLKLPELNPPLLMPQGNIGTQTKTFLTYINECRLPPKIVKKLGLKFPRTKPRKEFGSVPYDYGYQLEKYPDSDESDSLSDATVQSFEKSENNLKSSFKKPVKISEKDTRTGDHCKHNDGNITTTPKDLSTINSHLTPEIENYKSVRAAKKAEKRKTRELKAENIEEKMIHGRSDSEEDNDDCEEWERHEANYDDPSNQARNSERLFEDRIELKWEKGGSGLVFYTDAQYWKKLEGDFDEQCADDWDVDMSGYYDDGAGDKDSKDLLSMRRDKRRWEGIEDTSRYTEGKIGKFEKHTKGFGRKIMEQQGWKDGHGLGASVASGLVEALENEGQNPRSKKGLGFHGEKINRFLPAGRKKQTNHLITTIYDNTDITDPVEPLLRRNEPYAIKHTPGVSHIKFTKSTHD